MKDKIGRRKVLLICSTLVCLSGIVYISSTSYNFILLSSGFAGFFSVGLGQYTLPLELVSADKRFIVGTLITAGWAIGAGWLLLSSFIFRNWRYAATMNFTLVLLCLPTYYFFIPESPRKVFQISVIDCFSCKVYLKTNIRWLWRQGRRKEAIEVLRWMARINQRSIDGKMLDSLEQQDRLLIYNIPRY